MPLKFNSTSDIYRFQYQLTSLTTKGIIYMSETTLSRLIQEIDILIRACYPLIAVNTYEEGRFMRAMQTISDLN
jgi:hypothetical protein